MLAGHGQGEAGQELEATVLFADLQDSTALAERLSPTRFSELLRGFYAVATDVITARGSTIDKFLGDGLVALFLPGPSGLDHARRALEAAHALIAALDPDGDGHPAAGPHRGAQRPGLARPGAGSPRPRRVTALGDTVNVTAHLCGAAPAGHVAASAEALRAAGRPDVDDASPAMQLKGRRERVRGACLLAASRAGSVVLRGSLRRLEQLAVLAVPFGFELVDGDEAQRGRVDAVAHAARSRPIREDMAQVRIAALRPDLGAAHEELGSSRSTTAPHRPAW